MNDEDLDLSAWQVPPPAPFDRSSLLVRATAAPPRRPRLRWLLAAIVLVNAAVATLIVILLSRPPETRTIVLPGGAGDAQVRALLQRLDQEQRELEAKLAEIKELRALVVELQAKLEKYEQRERTVPTKRPPVEPGTCDEVSCVLSNYQDRCCSKFKFPDLAIPPPADEPPDALDRASIQTGMAPVKVAVKQCHGPSGTVKVRVRVDYDGKVVNVEIAQTPDPVLGACVAHAVQRAVFPKSKRGGSFTYPFVF